MLLKSQEMHSSLFLIWFYVTEVYTNNACVESEF